MPFAILPGNNLYNSLLFHCKYLFEFAMEFVISHKTKVAQMSPDIPMSGLFGYCTDLRSMTGGRGDYSYEFARYEQTPSDVQEKEVAARAAKVAENNAED